MAKLVFSENGLVSLISSKKIRVFDSLNGSCQFSCDLSDINLPKDIKQHPPVINSDDKQDASLGHGNICAFSQSGQLYALCTSNKLLSLWKTDTWQHLGSRLTDKKPTAVVFTNDDQHVVVADKAGDVYKFPTKDVESKGVFVLGHISMIMDMEITKDDKYLITAERDEKIRVSHFPNAHSIKSYCLGHTDFVSCIKLLPTEDILVSGSGDGNVIFWDYKAGIKVFTENLNESKTAEVTMESEIVSCIACCKRNATVCVTTEKNCRLHLYNIDSKNKVTKIPALSTSVPSWYVSFDSEGLLWCLLPNQHEPVVAFRLENMDSHRKYVKIETFTNIPLYNGLNDWSFLKECQGKELQLSLLRKKTDTDNMKEYLNRKEERIQQKKARQAELQEKETKNTTKRAKV